MMVMMTKSYFAQFFWQWGGWLGKDFVATLTARMTQRIVSGVFYNSEKVGNVTHLVHVNRAKEE